MPARRTASASSSRSCSTSSAPSASGPSSAPASTASRSAASPRRGVVEVVQQQHAEVDQRARWPGVGRRAEVRRGLLGPAQVGERVPERHVAVRVAAVDDVRSSGSASAGPGGLDEEVAQVEVGVRLAFGEGAPERFLGRRVVAVLARGEPALKPFGAHDAEPIVADAGSNPPRRRLTRLGHV